MQKDGEQENRFMFINEMFVYKDVIPYFKKFLSTSVTKVHPENWTPRIYFIDTDVSVDVGLESSNETVLVMENLKIQNYRLGPRIDLNEAHLRLMILQIAEYHAVSYALRINKDPIFERLTEGLLPHDFMSPEGKFNEIVKALYDSALERIFNCIGNNEILNSNKEFMDNVQKFKKAVAENPLILMQTFLATDGIWSILLHGDYNRNNVLFKYDCQEGHDNPKSVKMIDFQEVRYATPAIDLAFFMYMNIHPTLRPSIWKSLLKLYHETTIECVMDILKCKAGDLRLTPYKFEKFLAHFNRHAFYGAMVGIMFSPFMASPEDECQRIRDLFGNDVTNPEFRRMFQMLGGEDIDKRITSIVTHAYEEGYMKIFTEI